MDAKITLYEIMDIENTKYVVGNIASKLNRLQMLDLEKLSKAHCTNVVDILKSST